MEAAIQRFEPDVVHFHNIYHQLSPSVLRPVRRSGARAVMTLHDYKLACPSYQLLDHGTLCDACVGHSTLHAVRRRCKGGSVSASALLSVESGIHRVTGAYGSVDRFISPSRFLADVMARAGVAPERLVVVPHFLEAHDEVTSEPRRDVVVAGRLSPEKGIDVAVRAAARLPEGVRLHVAGDGPERGRLEDLAVAVAPGRVTFHGRLDKDELRRLVASSVATVVPSRWHENQPMTILESYAVGVPVVVTHLGGMPELVNDGVDGCVVPPDDPRALAAALTGLLEQPAVAAEMGRRGLERLRRDFDPALHLARLDAVYRGLPQPETLPGPVEVALAAPHEDPAGAGDGS
jgi:glycosyltransferase involved in cell wall biosynthesis